MDDVNYNHPLAEPRGGFVLASVILGGLSILSLSTFVLPVIFGSLGVLFAFLAKKGKDSFRSFQLAGFVTSLVGLIIGFLVTVFMLFSAFYMLKPENRSELNTLYETVYGVSFDEYADTLYDGDFSELLDQFYE